jgi:intracellular sulfur oxidation DsrE/DsrF family protein
MRTVFHVSTEEQLAYVDAKVQNLLADETVDVEHVVVVVDAPDPIDAAANYLSNKAEAVVEAGGDFEICSNAARGAVHDVDDLPEGVEQVSSGVGELTRLQNRG